MTFDEQCENLFNEDQGIFHKGCELLQINRVQWSDVVEMSNPKHPQFAEVYRNLFEAITSKVSARNN